ncbi:MAG: TIGR01212 family radical SAM protein [Bdellovibrionales bacterium]|jgi:uncharacterized protein|nr:TIGR01212 family radical SAM protein [Bdellovibrionales bacterium]MBT3527466.1 TIGR01212 family radical SAM protein [Bdellovibrionales bacterium]MBT7670637.1 TIGR01212 family radical SAM protein [Bdellovibrionales bacterium]MBT7768313.1 TIGR01212 family radical SAM protein [Bdellovibrionales bacterium]
MKLKTSIINSYADYLRQLHGERVQKVTVDGGFTCPNRDGLVGVGGCTFCNNASFSPAYSLGQRDLSIKEQVERGILRVKQRYRNVNKFVVYFQAYSNTYAPLEQLQRLYQEALDHPQVIGLAIGTRPDCLRPEIVDYLDSIAQVKDITLEIGVESIYDDTLQRINRGHDYRSFEQALTLLAPTKIRVATHLILGFPWESKKMWLESADHLSSLPIDFLKIHQLHIVKGTALGEEYQKEPFSLMTEDEYQELLINFLSRLNPKIVIQRLFGQAPQEMLLSPVPRMGTGAATEALLFEMKQRGVYQGILFKH